ncbi:exopolysaccharide biosynthesis polyprenyl glycosylphosphotransferase [Klenkia marina]|uniref:Exopolysaccharide biosynthesis polyprenyl glycosylphosphotransferase n=1 Tax=Klenkia marina TaxID=1960309 RepID=A0A1G4XFR6_9ACTN|nr:exopolysaccharide biosynthesis polyprenyl glycosylphosphotransferase [Klenkia marina]
MPDHVSSVAVTQRSLRAPRASAPAAVPESAPGSVPVRQGSWIRGYVGALVAADAVLGAAAGLIASSRTWSSPRDTLFWVCLALPLMWPVVVALAGGYAARVAALGREELSRVLRGGIGVLAVMGFTSYALELALSRALVVVVMPTLVLASLVVRYVARWRLRSLRRAGRCSKRVLVVGRGRAVLGLTERLAADPASGLVVVGACVTDADRRHVEGVTGLPVAGLDGVRALAAELEAETVAVTSASETAAEYLRRLSWDLEGSGIELLVAPGLIEVAGPRLHIRPYDGLPLLAVEQPRFEGWRRVVKTAVDRGLALAAVVVLAPVLVAVAVAVRLDSPGPVLFRQERVGKDGRTFSMIKFRSMVADAEGQLAGLHAANEFDGVLFKIRRDPRITRTGRWLRRLSLDELPQLFNVLGGSMSLVGPRPPLPVEVARYDGSATRRLLVKPGLTGLWQISGRSDLSWEESVRLDLRYVENWSLAMDASILWRTGRAVLTSSGAY